MATTCIAIGNIYYFSPLRLVMFLCFTSTAYSKYEYMEYAF